MEAFERKRNDLCYMNGLWGKGVNIKSGVGFLSALNASGTTCFPIETCNYSPLFSFYISSKIKCTIHAFVHNYISFFYWLLPFCISYFFKSLHFIYILGLYKIKGSHGKVVHAMLARHKYIETFSDLDTKKEIILLLY